MRVTVPRLPLRGADGGRKEVLVRAALDPGDWERYLHPHDREAALAALLRNVRRRSEVHHGRLLAAVSTGRRAPRPPAGDTLSVGRVKRKGAP